MPPYKVILFVAVALLTGCVNISTNDRTTPEYWGGYVPHALYTLPEDVFVMQLGSLDGLAGKRLALVPPENLKIPGRQHLAPASIDAFKRDPATSTKHVIGSVELQDDVAGIATKGTRVQATRMQRNHGWSMWFGKHDWLTPFGVFLDGSFAGKEADLSDMSDSFAGTNSRGRAYQPIPSLLARTK